MQQAVLSAKTLQVITIKGMNRRPSEAVGVIVKGDKVIELPNRSMTPHNSFILDVNDIAVELQNMRITMTPSDWESLVIWHTHPGGLIGPSRIDMQNRVERLLHLVVAMTESGPVPTFY